MSIPLIAAQKFKNTVERILHVPGNYTGGILEMAVILDMNLPKEQVEELLPELLHTLKMHSEVFRNVRLNMLEWHSDEKITTSIEPMSMVMLSGFYHDYQQEQVKKNFEILASKLKLYQARSKLLILLTDGKYLVVDEKELERKMQPFLDRKLMQVVVSENGIEDIRYRFAR
jgi:predicted DNA-binding protein (UPF0251 family)